MSQSSTQHIDTADSGSSSGLEFTPLSNEIKDTPNTRSVLDYVYDKSAEIEEEFKKITSQGASVHVLKSKVISVLKFLENICEEHEQLAHENNLNIFRYENIVKNLEEKCKFLKMENQELKRKNEGNDLIIIDLIIFLYFIRLYNFTKLGIQRQINDDSHFSSSIGTIEEYGQRIPSDNVFDDQYYFGKKIDENATISII